MALSEKERKQSATFGGDRFPMPDRKHARLALELLPTAKNISSGEEEKVRVRARRMLAANRVTERR